jgi:hypothetical protein
MDFRDRTLAQKQERGEGRTPGFIPCGLVKDMPVFPNGMPAGLFFLMIDKMAPKRC